MFLILLFI